MNKDTEKRLDTFIESWTREDGLIGVTKYAHEELRESVKTILKEVQQQAYDDMEKIIGEDEPVPKGYEYEIDADYNRRNYRDELRAEQRKKLKERTK